MPKPLVSVVMSVYNGERYLKEALDSILSQTYPDFEFIIIDDGSTDGTADILASYREADGRVNIYRQDNRGLIVSLNRGCSLAKGKYIARMDADDISLPDRLECQVDFMESHPEIGVAGSWIEYIDAGGRSIGQWRTPAGPAIIKWSLMFGTCLAHPSVLMRKAIFDEAGPYRPEALHVEDYDLWTRAAEITSLANIPEIKVKRRIWGGNISVTESAAQEKAVVEIMHSLIAGVLGEDVSRDAVAGLRRLTQGTPISTMKEIKAAAALLKNLRRAYLDKNSLTPGDAKIVRQDVGGKLYALAKAARNQSVGSGIFMMIEALALDHRLLTRFLAAKLEPGPRLGEVR